MFFKVLVSFSPLLPMADFAMASRANRGDPSGVIRSAISEPTYVMRFEARLAI